MDCFRSLLSSFRNWIFQRKMKKSKIHENIPKVQERLNIMIQLTKKEQAVHHERRALQNLALQSCHATYHSYKSDVAKKKYRVNTIREQSMKAELQTFVTALVQTDRQCSKVNKTLMDLQDKHIFFTNSLSDAKSFNDNYELQKLINLSGVDTDMMSKVHDQQMEMEERLQVSAQELADRQMASANVGINSISADSEVASRMEEMLRPQLDSDSNPVSSLQNALYSYVDSDPIEETSINVAIESPLYA